MRSPTLLPIRMNAAETSASSAMADWTPLAVVPISWTTAEIDTFISDVSTTSTNIAMASRMASRVLLFAVNGADMTVRTGKVVNARWLARAAFALVLATADLLTTLPVSAVQQCVRPGRSSWQAHDGVAGPGDCGHATPAAAGADPGPVLFRVGICLRVVLPFLLREEFREGG
jgi:hypothetical protein